MFNNFENWYSKLQEPYRFLILIIMILCWDIPIGIGINYGIPILAIIGFLWLIIMFIWGFWRNL